MHPLGTIGKLLMILGLGLAALGLLFFLVGKANPGFLKLPGDIYYKKDGFTFYFPLVTCLLLSLIISFLLNIFSRR
ncbi:MAG TPA: DUF2905 domain-containing protein [Syntrophomonadaceae bacterium]|nr:DUF2905 domain-containing protein [Syntrophomonadaceae bacterium]